MAILLVSTAPRMVRRPGPEAWFAQNAPSIRAQHQPAVSPDIYYIVPDRYCNSAVLRSLFGFDNGPFLDSLARLGFYIAAESRSNYPRTSLSLASSLNMVLLDGLARVVGPHCSDRTFVRRAIQRNAVVRTLKRLGYRYVHIGSWWMPTCRNALADENLTLVPKYYRLPGRALEEYTVKLLRTTILYPFMARFLPVDFNDVHRRMALYQFDQLERVALRPGPKFVFAHVLFPHEPFVLGAAGEALSEQQIRTRPAVEMYLDQVRYANKRVLRFVRAILALSPRPPVIILQADEGLWFCDGCSADETLRARQGILNAYFLPDSAARAALYPAITPVNSFRVVFNGLFGAQLPMEPDRATAIKDDEHPYVFTDVTERVRLPDTTQRASAR